MLTLTSLISSGVEAREAFDKCVSKFSKEECAELDNDIIENAQCVSKASTLNCFVTNGSRCSQYAEIEDRAGASHKFIFSYEGESPNKNYNSKNFITDYLVRLRTEIYEKPKTKNKTKENFLEKFNKINSLKKCANFQTAKVIEVLKTATPAEKCVLKLVHPTSEKIEGCKNISNEFAHECLGYETWWNNKGDPTANDMLNCSKINNQYGLKCIEALRGNGLLDRSAVGQIQACGKIETLEAYQCLFKIFHNGVDSLKVEEIERCAGTSTFDNSRSDKPTEQSSREKVGNPGASK